MIKQGKNNDNMKMRGDKIPTVKGNEWKYPFWHKKQEKGAGQWSRQDLSPLEFTSLFFGALFHVLTQTQ